MSAMMQHPRPTNSFNSEFLFFKVINGKTLSYFCDFHRLTYTDGTIHYRILSDEYSVSGKKSISIDFAFSSGGKLLIVSYEGNPPGELLREAQLALVEHLA